MSERIDTSSALGKMVFRLLSTLNEFERDQLAERTACAMAHLRKNNRRISSRISLGYDFAADGNTLLVNPAEQETMRQICSWRQQGMTMVSAMTCSAQSAIFSATVKPEIGKRRCVIWPRPSAIAESDNPGIQHGIA